MILTFPCFLFLFSQLIGRANFSFFRFGADPIIRPDTIRPAEPYERGPKDVFLVNPGEIAYVQGFFDLHGRCQYKRTSTHKQRDAHKHIGMQSDTRSVSGAESDRTYANTLIDLFFSFSFSSSSRVRVRVCGRCDSLPHVGA